MTAGLHLPWCSRQGRRSAVTLLAVLALLAATPAARSGGDGTGSATCGRMGDVASILLGLQKPATTTLWRDKILFVLRDGDDGSLWAFSIKNTTVHPAVRCRRAPPGARAADIETAQICAAGDRACASFASQADKRFDAVSLPEASAR